MPWYLQLLVVYLSLVVFKSWVVLYQLGWAIDCYITFHSEHMIKDNGVVSPRWVIGTILAIGVIASSFVFVVPLLFVERFRFFKSESKQDVALAIKRLGAHDR